ncbi:MULTISPECIES: coiled-coil domain-containing protein [unclassified Paenibacillus]|uniref:coiled-coil domain-containing protein n=1 Tax=unclassified Paenibacillus TaxID=185978 RepID=UPI0030F4C02B
MLSRNILSRRFAFLLILLLCTMLPLTSAASLSMGSSAAAVSSPPDFPDNEETRRLLEQTLSSAEIEREILRITAEQKVLEKKVSLLSKQAAEKEAAIADQQERAGAVIRSYYMGDRDSLLAALLSAKSISRMLALYDYYEIIIGQDRDILDQYEEQYKDMKSTITASLRSSKELEELKTALTEQKTRVAALNEEIEGGISASSDPESMSALLNEFTRYWENIGIHEVKTYFKALSSAMNHLPQFVQSKSGMLTRKGMTYTLALKEEDLNTFLISQNELFKDFAFHFNKGQVTASGTSGGLTLTLTGHYTIENEPVNGLMFHVDNVVFNGLELPDSTRQSLEEEFDLGFYPEKIVSLLHATEVESKEGVLYVKLSISF